MIKSRISMRHFSFNSGSVMSVTEKILPFFACILIAFALAWVTSSSLEWYFSMKNYASPGFSLAGKKGLDGVVASGGAKGPSISDFVSANPFNVKVYHTSKAASDPARKQEQIFSLEGMTLSGTIPGIGAQLRDGDLAPFILKGQEYKGYTLKDVGNNRAFFVKNDEEYILHLFYDVGGAKNNASRTNESQIKKTVPVNNRISPSEVGKNGTIARELVNDLLMNPFNEMKKVRLRAKFKDGEALGIEVQWLARDSLLRELGVSKGDIVQSINGVPINNMGDISNAINSLMGGDRFEVEVLRKGEKVPLTYTVK